MTERDDRLYVKAFPLAWNIPMRKEDHYLFGAARCAVKIEDECGGPYLIVEFHNDEPQGGESIHAGFFCTHEDIDRFAQHLHNILTTAETSDDS